MKYIFSKDEIELVKPSLVHKNQVMKMKEDFLKNNEGFDGCSRLEDNISYEEWLDFDDRLRNIYKESFVPSTVYLGIRKIDGKLVGIIDYRHSLSEFLLNYGGNIGYSTVIDERRKGYAKEMLRQLKEIIKEEGINKKVLLCCDKENIASSKTIIANGGILENEISDDVNLTKSGVIQRYWIEV